MKTNSYKKLTTKECVGCDYYGTKSAVRIKNVLFIKNL